MRIWALLVAVVLLSIFAGTDGRKSGGGSKSRGNSGSWWSRSRGSSRTTHRPRTQPGSAITQRPPAQSGSHPGQIGWNVPAKTDNKATNTNVKPPPSAPISKTTATNSQAAYNPSAPHYQAPSYNPSAPHYPGAMPGAMPGGYPYGSHSYGGQYPSHNTNYGGYGHQMPNQQVYRPSYSSNPSSVYTQPAASPQYVQPAMAQAPALTVYQPQSRGIGDMVKEAIVYSSVSAGVSAAVNRLLPGGIYGTRSSGGGGSGSGGSQVVNNYYYSNQTDQSAPAAPGQPAPAAPAQPAPVAPSVATAAQPPVAAVPPPDQKNEATSNGASNPKPETPENPTQANGGPNMPVYVIPSDEIKKLSESLFEMDKNNAYKYVTVNLQGETKEDSTADDAPSHLLDVKSEAYEIPTIKSLLMLHDNYEMDVKTKETVTPEERKEESELLDTFLETDVFKATMKFLADKEFLPNDMYEFKDSLKRIWFSQFKRIDGEPSSSGFEALFLTEKLDNFMIGPQNWIYYAKQEELKKLDYRGYIKDLRLGEKAEAIRIRTAFNIPDTKQSVTTLLVGLSPELEMALYTVCFYVRPNDVCPISLGGKEVIFVSTRLNYFGKDIMIASFVAG